ncbi:MAG: serine/threonine-protein kinase [Egibacteraceae bacterium]
MTHRWDFAEELDVVEARNAVGEPAMTDRWNFAEGNEIAPGRHAVQLLGRGERYETYLATDDHLLTPVVLKVLRPDRLDDRSAHRGLAAEAAALERTRHPVIVRSFGAVLDGPVPHLVLEHLEGPPLSMLVRKYGPLPLEQLVPLAVQLCAGLHYLAATDLLHLDVKPRNVVMGAPPRLIDLSVARSVADAAELRHRVGTDAFMAPEQWDPVARGPVGPPADVWGLGATLYHALTGRAPFTLEGDDSRSPEDPAEVAPLPETVPGRLADLVHACLAPRPAERPTATDLALSFEPFVAALPRRPVLSRLRPRLGVRA